MVNLFRIKNIWNKIYFHPLFYIIVVVSLLTGYFRSLLYFSIIIFIHELGHTMVGIIIGSKLNKIVIYPYGGCSKLEYDINIKLVFELIILLAGPIMQILFTYFVYYFNFNVETYFYTYSKFILVFNLIPIYPLDGGRIVNIILAYLFSFYNSLKYTYYISYFIYMIIFFYIIIYNRNLFFILILLSLGIELYREIKKKDFYFNKFLLERYLKKYQFKKIKRIKSIYSIKRDYYHLINNMFEKEYLNTYFK